MDNFWKKLVGISTLLIILLCGTIAMAVLIEGDLKSLAVLPGICSLLVGGFGFILLFEDF